MAFHRITSVLILFFTYVFISAGCKATTERVFDPSDSKSETKNTLVGFLLLDETEQKDFSIAVSYVSLQPLSGENVKIDEIVELNPSLDIYRGSYIKTSFYYFEEEKESYVSFSNHPKKSIFNPNKLDGEKEYLIRELNWTRSCGNKCRISMNSRLNPFKSVNTLKIKGKPGEIVFLGIYTIKTNQIPGTSSFTIEFNRISDDSEFYHRRIDPLQEKIIFDPQFGKNQKSAEIQFLKSILEMQKSGFWYEKAKEKLNTLIR
ncbi:hypothetical protein EHQ42_17375 [Leptospira levettii]|uniref:hypothetical protein n=1 Tax=Leptospira levettii TaxID=2023178 RepID=UPI001082A1D9|nr:hypothetical protein [Leptospira levettii]TGL09671.1 hypothetical protein EHQ42_17375 [Leptospira levettii]